MNPRILMGILVIAYVSWRFYDAWSADALSVIPPWRLLLWGGLFAAGVFQIATGVRSRNVR